MPHPASSLPHRTPRWVPAPPSPWTRRDLLLLGLVLVIALGVRLGYGLVLHTQPDLQVPVVDEHVYHTWAQSVASGDLLGQGIFRQSPLYPYLLGALYALAGPQPAVALVLQFLAGTTACGLLFVLGRRLFSSWAGFWSGVGGAVYAVLFFYEGTLLTATLIHFLNLCVLWSAYHAAERGTTAAWAGTGALVGLSTLARPNLAPFLAVLLFWLWAQVQDPERRPRFRSLALACALTAAAVVLPVTLRNVVVLHEAVISVPSGALNFYLGNVPDADATIASPDLGQLTPEDFVEQFRARAQERLGRPLTFAASGRYWFGQSLAWILTHPGAWLSRLGEKSLEIMNDYENCSSKSFNLALGRLPFLRWPWLRFGTLLPLAVLGLIAWWPRRGELFPLYGYLAVYLLSLLLLFPTSEYRLALVPVLLLAAGSFLADLPRHARTWPAPRWLAAGALAAFCVWTAFRPVYGPEERRYHLFCDHLNLGLAQARLGEDAAALKTLSAARPFLSPSTDLKLVADLELQDMDSNFRLGRNQAALEAGRRLLPRIMNHALLLDRFGQVMADHQVYELSLLALDRALSLDPDRARTALVLGRVLLEIGQPLRARSLFIRAAQDAALAPEARSWLDRAREAP